MSFAIPIRHGCITHDFITALLKSVFFFERRTCQFERVPPKLTDLKVALVVLILKVVEPLGG